jgi:hypothetical protein
MSAKSTVWEPSVLLERLVEESDRETRMCSRCKRHFPIGAFRLRRRGSDSRHHICRLCHNQSLRDRRRQRRRTKIHEFTSNAQQVYYKGGPNALHALVAETAREFGGISQLARTWKEAIDAAIAAGRHCSVLRSFNVATEMLIAGDQLAAQKAREKVGYMDRQQIEARMAEDLRRLIQREPSIAILTAASIGWEVRPPGETEWRHL